MKRLLIGLLFCFLIVPTGCDKETEPKEAEKSKEAKVLKWKFGDKEASISGTDIKITYPFGTDRTALTAKASISPKATISPNPWLKRMDYTNPVNFTVTAEDGTTKKRYNVNWEIVGIIIIIVFAIVFVLLAVIVTKKDNKEVEKYERLEEEKKKEEEYERLRIERLTAQERLEEEKKKEEGQQQKQTLANTNMQETIESINVKLGFILFFIIVLLAIQVYYIAQAETAKNQFKKEMRKWNR